jgi:hypothetical protein
VMALRDSTETAGMSPHPPVPPRPAWFNVITVCGLVVLLLPVNSGRLRDWVGLDRQAGSNVPSVHGWSEQRLPPVVSFDGRDGSGYRGLVAPPSLNQTASASVPSWNAGYGTAWAPVRVAFGAEMAAAPRVSRFVLRNVPASATLSRGQRMPDGTWVIDAPVLNEVVIALADEPSRDLTIEVEGQGVDGDVVARDEVRAGQALPAFAVAKPSPRVRSANAAAATTPHTQAPAVIADSPAAAVAAAPAAPAAEPSRRSRVADVRPPVVRARARSRVTAEPLSERGTVVRTSASNMRWNKLAFDRD